MQRREKCQLRWLEKREVNDCEWLVTYWNFTISNGELVSYHIQMVSWIKNPSSSSMLGELGRPHNLYLSPPVDMLYVAKGPSPKQKMDWIAHVTPPLHIYMYIYMYIIHTYCRTFSSFISYLTCPSFCFTYILLLVSTCLCLQVDGGLLADSILSKVKVRV